jgi:hypothetical protein
MEALVPKGIYLVPIALEVGRFGLPFSWSRIGSANPWFPANRTVDQDQPPFRIYSLKEVASRQEPARELCISKFSGRHSVHALNVFHIPYVSLTVHSIRENMNWNVDEFGSDDKAILTTGNRNCSAFCIIN